MATISHVKARQIFDSRGNPTVEVNKLFERDSRESFERERFERASRERFERERFERESFEREIRKREIRKRERERERFPLPNVLFPPSFQANSFFCLSCFGY
jgi:hypothetical protein